VARLTKQLRGMKHNAAEIHSDRSLSQRKEALKVLNVVNTVFVATDIAARGIDVKE